MFKAQVPKNDETKKIIKYTPKILTYSIDFEDTYLFYLKVRTLFFKNQ